MQAFSDDPLMHYLFADQGEHYLDRLRDFMRFSCEVQFQLQWPLLGVVPRTRLAGAVLVSTPDQAAWPEALTAMYTDLTNALGKEATARLERYATLTDAHLPRAPLLHIGLIGVRPQVQGRGYARLLLDAVHRLAARHSTATGVGLDTENAANVAFYERMGYRVVAEMQLDDLTVWSMFRPNEADPQD